MRKFKKKAISLCLFLCLFGLSTCGKKTADTKEKNLRKEAATPEVRFPEKAKNLSIYEVNIRQYTPEGTFKAFLPHIERLKKMGVGILWIMPVQPIGEEKRKGRLGSYYSIQDYKGINPEFGNLEDFKEIVKTAHDNGMYVILDWVANHTSWDHSWIETHSDYYTKDSLGNIMAPVADWEDVADLNYGNDEMHEAMIDAMKYWVTEADIDGFRCDVAGMVPMTFWNKAKAALDKEKDLFMLAEWDDPKMHNNAFHMTYGWDFHHLTNHIAQGKANADSIDAFINKDLDKFGKAAFRMNFTSNHDENSWNGTVGERYGIGAKMFAVLVSTVQGMPLVYNGQEAGLDKRLSFFDKDTIHWANLSLESFYTTLLKLKKNNKALWNGEYGGKVTRISNDNPQVYAFYRKLDDNMVIVLLNLTGKKQSFTVTDSLCFGEHKDIFTEGQILIEENKALQLDAFGYMVFTNKTH